MNNNLVKAHLSLLFANLFYGFNYLIVKNIVPEYISPIALSVFRSCGATILLWSIARFFKTEKVDRCDYWKLFVSGLIGVTANQSLLILSLKYTSSINASIITTSNPIFVMIISYLFLRYPITPIKFVGVMLGAVGALLVITSGGEFNFGSDTFCGDLIILLNTILYSVYLVWTKPLMQKYQPMTVMRWSFLFGAIAMLTFGVGDVASMNFDILNFTIISSILYVVIFATFFTYLLNVIGLKYVNPTTVSIYVYLQPLIVALIGAFCGNDSFDIIKIVAMILVFVGVYLVNKSNVAK